jgi:hypothetical protein
MVAVVTIYDAGILRALADDGEPWTRDVANEVRSLAVATCPGGSGTLKASHGVEQNRSGNRFTFGFNVYNSARHALWVHEGTGLYGPTRTAIVPKYTPKKKYLHLPPGMGFQWTLTTRLATPRKRRKGVRGPYVRIFDPGDPYGHAESAIGMPPRPWLARAGETVARRHGAT